MENDYNQYNEVNGLNNYSQPVESMEYNEQPYPDTPPVPMVSFGGLPPAVEAIKSAGKSAAFLITTICYTISVIISLIYTGVVGLGMSALTSGLAGELALMGVDESTQELMSTTYTSSFITTLFIAICPMVLMLIGMWVIYGSSKKSTPTLKGLGACRAAIIIWDVLMWIATVFTVLVAVLLITLSGYIAEELSYVFYEDVSGTVVGVIVGISVGLLIYVILALIYITKMLKTTRVVKDIVNVGYSKKKVSVYLIVINFFIAVGGLLSLAMGAGLTAVVANLPEIMSEIGLNSSEIAMFTTELEGITGVMVISAIPQILGIVCIICINIVLIKLRKKLKSIFAY